ncbi:maleylpyruvate isomerase N-terminal domain-containing protein [Streptomyces sp. NPDC059629]|uniref:maleylpyruvate isomerase N-terminal domain-containing protein n=1 Tax=Streptomyces sp. NPDC059629 TaxID=3346889 RepID=UPI0036AD599C
MTLMTVAGMKGFRLATQDLLLVAGTLDDAGWNRPSGAEGWRVKDVFSHAGQLISLLVSAVQGTLRYPDPPLGIERLNEVLVGAARASAVRSAPSSRRAPRGRIRQDRVLRLHRCSE